MGDKRSFFDRLYKLDDDSCSDDEQSAEDLRLAQLFAANRRDRALQPVQPAREVQHSAHRPQRKDHDREHPQLQHRPTAPAVLTSASQDSTSTSTGTGTGTGTSRARTNLPRVTVLRRANTISGPPSAMPKKRSRDEATTASADNDKKKGAKRAKTAKQPPMQPPERQLFKNLVFFFIKPDQKRPERKMRMEKAREYGAHVTMEFTDDVTHIIADKELKYDDVLQFLKLSIVPSKIPVTNPRWPGDCIKHGKLVDPRDYWYQVPGCPDDLEPVIPAADGPSNSSSPPSSESLQVQARPTTKQPLDTPESSPPELLPIVSTRTKAAETTPEPATANASNQTAKDALDEAIEECLAGGAINVEDFLDDDSEDRTTADDTGSETDSTTSSNKRSPKRKGTKTGSGTSDWQSHFQCMHKHDGKEGSQNPNSRTIQVLEEMMRVYDDMKDQWRTRSYRIAISSLKKAQDRYIASYDEAVNLPGVGDRLAKKIVEIATTDRLQRLEYAKLDPSDQILKLFHGIYGIGLVQARKFVAAGYKTLDDVKAHATLTDPQRIGLEHYHDFQQRIPRTEVASHGAIVAAALAEIDDAATSHIMGSYRRGSPDCGDIDIIITKDNAGITELHDVLDKLVAALFARKFLMCGLAIARHDDGTKWHGASRIGGPDSTAPWRRIDFLVVPGDEIGAAFLYFTGNDVFNRSMRLLASKKGMRLNQRGLYRDVMRGKDRQKFNEGTLLESRSEKRIFEILGVPYRPPEHRIC
ncbi:hypothetical protein Dda_6031 [Drechslerella dactyloides]|uniref:DNA polymerase lambda n=1 Tax=Drechslerella dactyloides TaxID=74499 RepID=A0AAD6NI38_DREDA|nr:hypothetical protein Dda_6031 [Drechslerella dactyloides]